MKKYQSLQIGIIFLLIVTVVYWFSINNYKQVKNLHHTISSRFKHIQKKFAAKNNDVEIQNVNDDRIQQINQDYDEYCTDGAQDCRNNEQFFNDTWFYHGDFNFDQSMSLPSSD